LFAIQTQQHSGRAGDLGLFDKQGHVHRHALTIGQVEIANVINRGSVGGKSLRLCFATASFHVEDVIGRNPVEPGAELAFTLKSTEARDGFDEHFLRHLFSILRLKNHAYRDVVDPCLVPQDKPSQGVTITVLASTDQLHILKIVAGDFTKGVVHRSAPCR
jgi:hypothetical protein